ncbi:hypothetical protein [Saccharopolyspora sp. 5N708]|uniref:hypothetical protein n=1 Tax=Saccharopolyspora sp. 5N708 TaxID=3457424 RepID=UPI003FD16F6A
MTGSRLSARTAPAHTAADRDRAPGSLLGIDRIFAPELARHPVFRTAVTTSYRRLREDGAHAVLTEDLRA